MMDVLLSIVLVILSVLLVVIALLAGFVWWRWSSVERGARKRDEALALQIDPITTRLDRGEPVEVAEVAALASSPQLRLLLYLALKHYERTDLFPARQLALQAQAEGLLAQWLMHPNEMQAAPAELIHVAELERPVHGRSAKWFVLRYRMPAGHWAEKQGWQLGLSGPFFRGEEPYIGGAASFSRVGDIYGKVTPEDLVAWYIGFLEYKAKSG